MPESGKTGKNTGKWIAGDKFQILKDEITGLFLRQDDETKFSVQILVSGGGLIDIDGDDARRIWRDFADETGRDWINAKYRCKECDSEGRTSDGKNCSHPISTKHPVMDLDSGDAIDKKKTA